MANYCSTCFHLDLEDCKYSEYYCLHHKKRVKKNATACSDYVNEDKVKSSGSYQRSGIDCYITTIVCEILGYPDDAEVLQLLRGFRDNFLKLNAQFFPMLYEYDQVGPQIAEALRNDAQKKRIALALLQGFLLPCSIAVKAGNAQVAINIYTNMVNMLKEKYGLMSMAVDYSIQVPLEDLGKARNRFLNTVPNI